MKIPGAMFMEVLRNLFKKSATIQYPYKKIKLPENYRGKIVFHGENCIGCKMCVRDCPSNAINIVKIGEKKFFAEFNLAKCIYCAQCVYSCPKKALEFSNIFELAVIDKDKLKVIYDDVAKKGVERQD